MNKQGVSGYPVKRIPEDIAKIFSRRMEAARIPDLDRQQYLKWLRFYLDFCDKYKHSPTHLDSSNAFMLKLTEKRQTPARQRQAAQSINVYLDIIKRKRTGQESLPVDPLHSAACSAKNGWAEVFDKVRDTIQLRNYSPKTYSTYAGWIGRFEFFVHQKPPTQVTMEDVKAFLT
jgi:hypothetical protein